MAHYSAHVRFAFGLKFGEGFFLETGQFAVEFEQWRRGWMIARERTRPCDANGVRYHSFWPSLEGTTSQDLSWRSKDILKFKNVSI
jgi:hypothetical protein